MLNIRNHGYEIPKQALETYSAASCVVLYPPLCGIIQLSNSATPIVTFRLFAFGIGVSRINITDKEDADCNAYSGILRSIALDILHGHPSMQKNPLSNNPL
jgi:hypothetical protein